MFIPIDLLKIKKLKIISILLMILGIGIFSFGLYLFKDDAILTSSDLSNISEKELEEIAQEIFNIRNKASLGKVKKLDNLYNTESVKGSWAYEKELNNDKYLRLWEGKQSINFKNIESKVFLRSVKEIEKGYKLGIAVTTEYVYVYKDEIKEENSFRIGTYHSLDIVKNKGKWIISGEWYEDPFINSSDVNEIATDNISKIISSKEKKDLSNIDDSRKRAIKYADSHCGVARPPDYSFHYNEDYKNYNFLGGDCTNFVSQTIHEAGMEKTLAWNYKGEGSRAWVNASEFANYMLYSGRGTLIANGTYEEVLESSYELLPGDYISFEKKGRIGHNAVVTGVDSKGYTLINTHYPDYYRVPWDLGWSNEEVRFWLVRVNY